MCVGVEFLVFNVLLHSKSEQKVIGNWFGAPIINNGVSNKKYTYIYKLFVYKIYYEIRFWNIF